ncbi:hypothetical protein GPECTOR_28g734 [Gonium pectorale]|uniref:Uncharacterized protein n=1 Tax=Gonium pectorale TaxID=33097 RepID=A0A150GET3_GONPE|nr:hypothetical protein GPECTOR_28g734 [Gonium pectorale]|eukprot:KXZ48328.1 hypothetical protein GPECTOR_28g734 [Gonium pectorale]
MIALPLLVLAVIGTVQLHLGKRTQQLPTGPIKVPCGTDGKVPNITDIYVIHSYWSKERAHLAPAICSWFKGHGGHLSSIPCTTFPGFWASNASREQILDLVGRRIVAPETHAKPQGFLTRLLYWLGFSSAVPLFDHQERVTNPSYLGTAASHLLAVQNWTLEMSRKEVAPADRTERHLLLFEDDAVLTEHGVATLQALLPRLDPCYDVLGLDSTDNFCAASRLADGLWRLLRLPRAWRASPSLVPVRTCYSRNTGLLISYKGALNLLSGLPVTREIDLWFRDLMTDRVLKAYVACPRVVPSAGLPTVDSDRWDKHAFSVCSICARGGWGRGRKLRGAGAG